MSMKSGTPPEIPFTPGSREGDVPSLLKDLQSCEGGIEKLTQILRERTEGVTSVERVLEGLFSENKIGIPTSSEVTEDTLSCRGFEKLYEDVNAARHPLESGERDTTLTRTALSRIMEFIGHHENQRELSLTFLREAALKFESIRKESEQENDFIKEKLSVKFLDIPPESAGEEIPTFSSTEERIAPRHVESIRLAISILKSITAITVSLRKKQKIRISYRKQLENAHVIAQEQLLKQRDVLRSARHAIDVTEEKIRNLHTNLRDQEKLKAQLVEEGEELDSGKNFKEESEHLDKVNEEVKKKTIELVALERALEKASLETQNAKLEDRGAQREADSHAVTLELALEALNHSNKRLISVENDNFALQELLGKSNSAREKYLRDVESQNNEIKVLQEETIHYGESKETSNQDVEALFVAVVEAKKKNELLQAQVDAIEIHRGNLQGAQKLLDETSISLRTESVRCRNELLCAQENVRVSRMEEGEIMRNIDYITFLQPPEELTHLSMSQMDSVQGETPRECLALRTAQLFQKARREHRRYNKEMNVSNVKPVLQQQQQHEQGIQEPRCIDMGIDEKQSITRRSPARDVTLQQQETESRSTTAAHNSILQHSQGNGLMTEGLFLTAENIPTCTTSRIVANSVVGNSSATPKPNAGTASPSPAPSGFFSSLHGIEDLTDTYVHNSQNEALSAESTATIARVNLRLQEILNRRY